MKVINKPNIENWSYRCKCDKCDKCESQLEINAMDICYTHSQGDGRYPALDTYNVYCPVCSHGVNIPVANISKIIQIEAQKRWAPRMSYFDR